MRHLFLWFKIMGLGLILCFAYLLTITIVRHEASNVLFLRQSAGFLFGVCLMLCGFRQALLGLATSVASILCLAAADLDLWHQGSQSLAYTLLRCLIPVAIAPFFIWRWRAEKKKGKNDVA